MNCLVIFPYLVHSPLTSNCVVSCCLCSVLLLLVPLAQLSKLLWRRSSVPWQLGWLMCFFLVCFSKLQVPNIVKALHKQLKEKSIKSRQGCFSLLTELANVLPGCLADHIPALVPGKAYLWFVGGGVGLVLLVHSVTCILLRCMFYSSLLSLFSFKAYTSSSAPCWYTKQFPDQFLFLLTADRQDIKFIATVPRRDTFRRACSSLLWK